MKRIVALLLALAMLPALCGCGGSEKSIAGAIGEQGSISDAIGGQIAPETDPAIGLYLGHTLTVQGRQMQFSDLYPGDNSMELKEDGSCVLTLDGVCVPGSWTQEGQNLSLTISGMTSSGTLADGMLSYDYMGSGVVMSFVKEQGASTEIPAETSTETPAQVPSAGFGGPHSCQLEEARTLTLATVSFTVPNSNWSLDAQSRTIYIYNTPSLDEAYSNSPRIQFETKQNLDHLNFYLDDFENLVELAPRTIGGIEMQGRTYRNVGMDWIEYYAELPCGVWISIKASKVSVDPGTEGGDILDSVTFG